VDPEDRISIAFRSQILIHSKGRIPVNSEEHISIKMTDWIPVHSRGWIPVNSMGRISVKPKEQIAIDTDGQITTLGLHHQVQLSRPGGRWPGTPLQFGQQPGVLIQAPPPLVSTGLLLRAGTQPGGEVAEIASRTAAQIEDVPGRTECGMGLGLGLGLGQCLCLCLCLWLYLCQCIWLSLSL